MHLTKNKLWELRQEIVLNSLYVADYQNSFGYTAKSVCDFFDGYMEYLGELATEQYGNACSLEQIFSFDNAENLDAWYGCFDVCPFQRDDDDDDDDDDDWDHNFDPTDYDIEEMKTWEI